MVEPLVDVELDRDAPATVDVRELLDVLCDGDAVACRVREAIRDEQWPAWGSVSAHDALIEDADEDWDVFDVLVARLEHLPGRHAGEGARTLGLIGGGDLDAFGRVEPVQIAYVEASGEAVQVGGDLPRPN